MRWISYWGELWRWVLWIVLVITFPLSIISVFLFPGRGSRTTDNDKSKMDIPDVFTMLTSESSELNDGMTRSTGSIILLIFSFSQTPSIGTTTEVLVPLAIITGIITGISAFLFLENASRHKSGSSQNVVYPQLHYPSLYFVVYPDIPHWVQF